VTWKLNFDSKVLILIFNPGITVTFKYHSFDVVVKWLRSKLAMTIPMLEGKLRFRVLGSLIISELVGAGEGGSSSCLFAIGCVHFRSVLASYGFFYSRHHLA